MTRNRDTRSRLWQIRPWHIAVVLLSILLIVFGVFRITCRTKLRNRIEAVRAAGYPVTYAELNAWYPMPTSGENAADYIMQAFDRLRIPEGPEKEQLPGMGAPILFRRTQPLDDQTSSAISTLLDNNAEALRLLEQATDITGCRYPVDFTLGDSTRLPDMSKCHAMVSLFCLKAALHAKRGEAGPAVDATIRAFRLADSLAQVPTIVSQRIGRICELRATATLEYILNCTTADAARLELLEQALAAASDSNSLERALISEQCFMLENLRRPMAMTSMPPSRKPSFMRIQIARVSGEFDLAQIRYMDWTDRYLTAARQPLHERVQAARELQRQRQRPHDRHVFVSEVTPAFHGVMLSDVEGLTLLLTARTALAIERYRLATGHLPGQLADLVPTYLEQVPQDAFDGQAIRYKRLTNGYVVYSIGRDMSDNDGREHAPVEKPGQETDCDITFTVERQERSAPG